MISARPEPRPGPPSGQRRSSWPAALSALLLSALLLRLVLAYLLLPGSGFSSDLGSFTAWSMLLAEHGPSGFYGAATFADYPPGYLYVLWLVGGLAQLIGDLAGLPARAVAGGLIKLPPMLADLGIGLVLFVLVRNWAGSRPDAQRLGLIAAALYLFNPISWYDSAIWGQTDSIGALVLLLGVAALLRGNSEGAAALAVLAGLVKPQFGVVLVPLVAVVLLRRHLLAPGSLPRHRSRAPALLRSWFEEERGAWRLLSSAVVGLILLLLIITPFGLDIPGFIRLMAQTAGGYDYLSVNAYNLWAVVGSEGRPPLAFGGGWSSDTVPLLGPLPGVAIGAGLLIGGFLVGLGRSAWRDDRRSIILVAIFLSLAFFVLPTRVHERYLFPVFALLPLLAVIERRWLWATVILAAASLINLHGVLTIPLYGTPNVVDLPLGELFREPALVIVSALLHTGVFAFVLWHLRPSAAAQQEQAEDALAGWQPPAADAAWLPSAAGRLLRLAEVVPLRRDRSHELVGESGGLLKRVDLLLLLLVFISALGLRTVRLEEPYSMYFDEVYHPRTGIEFLQHWQYGLPHSIYEWTHPHLAKYLMAAGIVMLGNNRVTETRELDALVRDAAVERRWSPAEEPGQAYGERLYVLSEGQLNTYRLTDLASLEPVPLPGGELLALDEQGHALYVADGAGGLWRLSTFDYDLAGQAGEQGARPRPDRLAPLEGLAGGLTALAYTGNELVAIDGEGNIIALDPDDGAELGRARVPGAVAVVAAQSDGAESLIVGGEAGFSELDAESLEVISSLSTPAPLTGMVLVTEGVEEPTVYAAMGSELQTLRLPPDGSPSLGQRLPMPNQVSDVTWNPDTVLIHVLGQSPDGGQETVYVVEPHSNAVFADARLPFAPQRLVLDTQPERPAQDRADLLALDAKGSLARVDVGSNAFAWRFPGVLAGALLAACLFLLARLLFERRSVALLAAALVLLDGMFFANARIAMNDTYVALFIVAALTLFAPLYLRRWRSRPAIALGFVGVGLLLGLALATKWVAAYAIGAVGLLILLRSALGRLLALAAMIALTGFLGHLAVLPPTTAEEPQRNFLFLLLMIALTIALAVGSALRPVRVTLEEMRLAIWVPVVLGVAAILLSLLIGLPDAGLLAASRLRLGGGGLLAFAALVYIGFWLAGRGGYGPLGWGRPARAGRQPSSAPPARGWLRPGSGPLGLSWPLALAAITLMPLAIYVLSYQPWIELGNRWWEGFPTGHSGQTFADLQVQMYNYHNYLRATHAASSPWWAWPLNLKPVWFEQQGYANDTTAVIYNTGNLVIFWLAIPAVAWVAHQAWRRRSLALTFVVVAFASLWLPWARIDRVAFQYHWFTVLPIVVLALAYFLAELWHGPSERTWRLARVAAALAITGPALLWLVRLPLCAFARVEQVNPGAEGCGLLDRQIPVTDIQLVGLLILLGAGAYLGMRLWPAARSAYWLREWDHLALPIALVAAVLSIVLLAAGALMPGNELLRLPLPLPELVALVALPLLAVPAYFVLRARDTRRFVVGVLVATAAWFLLWYPNFAGLPLPSRLAQAHLGLLPTWNHSFQFGANLDESLRASPDLLGVAAIAGATAIVALAAVWLVLTARSERARERRALSALGEPG